MENESFESEIDLFKKYSSDIARIIDSERSRTEGIEGEVGFKKERLKGKHQEVYAVTYIFPEGEVHAVEKHRKFGSGTHNGANLEKIMGKFPIVKDIYPTILYNNESALISEKINGLEDKEFKEFIYSNPEAMEQLLEETYEMFDSIFKTELDLANDISPFTGWNMMYDSEQERFRLFDSDTVSESTESYHVKMFHFFERVASNITNAHQKHNSKEITKGLSYLMNRFFQENPQLIDAETEKRGETHKLNPKVVELVQEKDTEGLLDYLNGEESYPVKMINKDDGPVIRVNQFVERHAVTIPVKPRAKPYGFLKENGKSIQIDTKEEYDKLLEEIVHTT